MRAGAQALSLLSNPINVYVLRALEDEPRPLSDLRRAVGSPQTTMRGHLRGLTETGIVERYRQDEFPGSVDYALGPAGRDLLGVARVLQDWLAESPDGPLPLESPAAKIAIKALTQGWSCAIVRALAARPLSLTELNKLIVELSYPALERRLGAMRLAGQIEVCEGRGRSTPYGPTPWLRRAVSPLAAAAHWEREHASAKTSPIGRIDVEAVFLLTVPVLPAVEDLDGTCRLVVDLRGDGAALAGVTVQVSRGRVRRCVAKLKGNATGWASGTAPAWLRAVGAGDLGLLEVGGDCVIPNALIEGLGGALRGSRLLT